MERCTLKEKKSHYNNIELYELKDSIGDYYYKHKNTFKTLNISIEYKNSSRCDKGIMLSKAYDVLSKDYRPTLLTWLSTIDDSYGKVILDMLTNNRDSYSTTHALLKIGRTRIPISKLFDERSIKETVEEITSVVNNEFYLKYRRGNH